MQRFGVTVAFEALDVSRQRELVESLPSLGYTDVWTGEADGFDAVVPLALTAAWAPSLHIGTGVIPVQTRGPAVLAQTAATLAQAAPGRFLLGIGASSKVVVEDWNGVPFEDPYRRTRDSIRFLRRALAGETVSMEGTTFTVRDFRLRRPPDVVPPIVLAALRPGMLRLAGREADGVVLNLLSADDVGRVVPYVAEGGSGKHVVAKIIVLPSEDPRLLAPIRRLVATYLNIEPYASFHAWLGRSDRLRASWEAWRRGDRAAAVAAVPEDVIDELVIHGSVETCVERIGRYVANGVTIPVVSVLPTGVDVLESLRSLAPATTSVGAVSR